MNSYKVDPKWGESLVSQESSELGRQYRSASRDHGPLSLWTSECGDMTAEARPIRVQAAHSRSIDMIAFLLSGLRKRLSTLTVGDHVFGAC